MELKTIKPVFGAVVMLGAVIFTSNAISAGAVAASGMDGQSTTVPDKGEGAVEKMPESGNNREKLPHEHMAGIMDDHHAQVALTIDKSLSLDVLGVGAGKRVEPCKKEKDNDCHFDRNKVFSEETLTITVVEGSCCTYISTGDDTYEFCPPEWPLEFIDPKSGESCPRYE